MSTKVDTHQFVMIRAEQGRHLQPSQFTHRHRETVRGGAVSGCGVSAAWMPRPSPQGRVYGVPATRHRPAQQTEKPEPLWLWLLLWNLTLPLRVPGRRPGR
ncbi:hypothetical protein D7Y57_21175 [Stenotrophomonas maltophilia]|nr:hypothetical protein [Stenotrophomonas maltophilia]PNY73526.1 hypothetical protein C1750_10430 [Stenotrophomonas pavanii]